MADADFPRSSRPLRAVFLDRDGVINEKAPEGEYVTSVAGFRLLPGAVASIERLAQAGLAVIVVTNQRGIARGRLTEADLAEIHAELHRLTSGNLTAIYHCPHEGGCACRKPGTGMFERAATDLGIDLRATAVVGDRASDMQAAASIGALRVHVGDFPEPLPELDYDAVDLADATDWVLTSGVAASHRSREGA